MSVWNLDQAFSWYNKQGWLVGCNFLPSSCINQIEMFQEDTFKLDEIAKEISWAKDLGFNTLRVYLHDLLWDEKDQFLIRFNNFLDCCQSFEIKPIIVLFDDCHYPFPQLGPQPLPIRGIHNSGWKQSPGHQIVTEIFELKTEKHLKRLQTYTQELLELYKEDERILMWDLYNEPGQFGIGEKSYTLLDYVWNWAHEIRPSQPLTSCLDGSIGDSIIALNQNKSDIITFHTYEAEKLEPTIEKLRTIGRPLMCTEYMAREYGTTFEFCLPIFKKYNIACYNWGLVAGRSQTNFNWETILYLNEERDKGNLVMEGDSLTEPNQWFHDIFRQDGSPYSIEETTFIKKNIKQQGTIMNDLAWKEFERVDIRVGTILSAEEFKEAIKPAIKMTIDFGSEIGIKKSSAQITDHYNPESLIGMQIAAVINFPEKQIGPFMSECLVTGFTQPDGSIILAVPQKGAVNGSRLA